MDDQELWGLMEDLEDVGLGDSQTKAYLIAGFYEDVEEHLDNVILTDNVLNAFIEVNGSDGADLFLDKLDEPKSLHMDPLVSSWFGGEIYLIIKGGFTKVRSVEERLRKEFVIEKEIELKNYKKLELNGISVSYGATGILGSSGTSGTNGSSGSSGTLGSSGATGYSGTTRVVYSSPGASGSWSTSEAIVSSSKTADVSTTTAMKIQKKMVQTSVKIEMPIEELEDLKDFSENEVQTYVHPLWEKIKGKLGF
jgi:hypothetical protein